MSYLKKINRTGRLNLKLLWSTLWTNMVDQKTLEEDYNNDALACYKYISANFSDHPIHYTDEHKVISVEALDD